MTQAVKTAIKFSGLSTYPNPLSEAAPGALQRANNVVIERPGIVTPRKGQQRWTAASNTPVNLLTVPQATTAAAFDNFNVATYRAGSGGGNAPDSSILYPGQSSSLLLGDAAYGGTAGSATVQLTLAASTSYVLSFAVHGLGGNALENPSPQMPILTQLDVNVLNTVSGVVAVVNDLLVLPDYWTRYQLQITTTAGTAYQLGFAASQSGVYLAALQLEVGSQPTDWASPAAPITYDVVTRLAQSTDALLGFVTPDGLPDSRGRLMPLTAGTSTVAANEVYAPPVGNAPHAFQTGQSVFITTADGVQKSDGATLAVPAGTPPALDISAALSTPAAGTLGFLAGGFATAYRVAFGSTDVDGRLLLGAPSNSVTLQNPGTLDNANAYWDPTVPTLPGSFQATANVFSVTLPFAKLAGTGTLTYDCYVIQGNNTLKGKLYIANGAGSTAYVRLTDPLAYFGVATSTVTIVLPFSATSPGTTALTTVNFDGRIFAGTATGVTLYETFAPGDPANLASASLSSSVASAAAGTITATSGAWASGMIGAVFAATVLTAQINVLLKTAGTFLVHADDELAFASLTARASVTSVSTAGGFDIITLDSFPAGLDASGSVQKYDIYRSSNAAVTITIPPEVDVYSGAFYQVYRSYVPLEITSGVDPVPTDNMQLCYQGTPTAGALTVTITDIAPDGVLGAALYTSPNQETINKARYQPPVCSDAALYQGCGLYANTYSPATVTLQLLAVSTIAAGTTVLQPGDIFYVNHAPFTATAGSPAAGQFQIISGTGSVVQDINSTLINLAHAVNIARVPLISRATTYEIVTAQVTSALSSGVPGGSIIFTASRGVGNFGLAFSRANGPFQGVDILSLVASGENFVLSPQQTAFPVNQPNALHYSPTNIPEAVPLLNYLAVGAANYPIKRILALPNSCLIFKEDGLFQLTGTAAENFVIQLTNSTAQLVANESVVALQNAAVAMTSQGVLLVNDSGSQDLSVAIKADLLNLTALPAFAATAFGVANEAKATYMLFSPSTTTDTLPTQAYVFNLNTGAWTRFDLARVCGLSNLADQCVYLGSANASPITGVPTLYRELAYADVVTSYGDEPTSGTVAGSNSSGVNIDLGTITAAAVAAAFQTGTTVATDAGTQVLSAINVLSTYVVSCVYATQSTDDPGTSGTIYYPTTCELQPVPIAADDPGMVKQFQEVVLSFINTTTANMLGTFASDFGQSYDYFPLTIPGQTASLLGAGWGEGAWGVQWGSGAAAADFIQTARQLVPREAARGHTLDFGFMATVAATYFGLTGLTVGWAPTQSLRVK